MIETPGQLEKFLDELKPSPYVSVDTEADSLYAYPVRLCLIQVSLPGVNTLIDPLSDVDLAPLFDALTGRELIFHGADYDLRLLFQSHGFRPTRVFDTMIAARLLGKRSFGLGALAQDYLGVTLEKTSQKANWGRRPLPERLQEYARADTRYLYPLARVLREDLEDLGRLGWHAESCARLIDECARPVVPDPEREWRIKGSNRLGRKGLAALRELWQWREEEALRSGRPPYFVLSHQLLVSLADGVQRAGPTTVELPPRLSRRIVSGLHRTIARARAIASDEWPEEHLPASDAEDLKRPLDASLLKELERRRNDQARDLALEPSLIASRAALEKLARRADAVPDVLMAWQRDLLGL